MEGRLSRSREHQGSMIAKIKDDQVKFQSEVRTALKELVTHTRGGAKTQEDSSNTNVVTGMDRIGETVMGDNSHHHTGVVFLVMGVMGDADPGVDRAAE